MRDQGKRRLSPQEKTEENKPLTIQIELFGQKVTVVGPLGLMGSFLGGLIVGVVFVLVTVTQWQQPSVLIDPVISAAAAKTVAAEPTPTLQPNVRVRDAITDQEKYRQLGRYLLNPGESVKIKIEPAVNKKFNWAIEPPDFGKLQGNTQGPEVTFTAPEENNAHGAIFVCESITPAPSPECPPGVWTNVLNISTSTGQ